MNHRLMRERLAAALATRPGWAQVPGEDHHFRHADAGVHLMVYGTEISLVFARLGDRSQERAVSASFRYSPSLALASILDVADAIVAVRLMKKAAAATEHQQLAGRMSG